MLILTDWDIVGVHYLRSVVLGNYASCVDIAVTYFAKVNVGEHCGIICFLKRCNLYIENAVFKLFHKLYYMYLFSYLEMLFCQMACK